MVKTQHVNIVKWRKYIKIDTIVPLSFNLIFMPIVNIAGKQVTIPEGSDSALHAVKFLNDYKDDAKDIFEHAHHDHVNGVAHFETNHPEDYHGSTKFTLIHTGDDKYELRKREHHLL